MAQSLLQLIEANGKSYEIKEVHRKYPDSTEQEFLQLKINRNYDALIKNNDFYFLCNEISEAVFTELPVEGTIEGTKELNNAENNLTSSDA